LQTAPEAVLRGRFGYNSARELRARAWFIDDSPVGPRGPAKSRSNETTFPEDVSDRDELESTLHRLTDELCSTLQKRDVAGRNVAIKVRLDDWTTVTRARMLETYTNDADVVYAAAVDLLRIYDPERPVRLLGVRVASFEDEVLAEPVLDDHQLRLPV
jgi:DNA polymerase-4